MRVTIDEAADLAKQVGYKGSLEELRIGIEDEAREHAKTHKAMMSSTSISFFAALIASDHLKENPHYYTIMGSLATHARTLGNAIANKEIRRIHDSYRPN